MDILYDANRVEKGEDITNGSGALEAMRSDATASPLYKNWHNQPTTEPPASFTDLLIKSSIYGAAAVISPALAGALATYEMSPERPAPGQHELVPLDQQERSRIPFVELFRKY